MTTHLDPAALEVLATTPAVLRAMLGRLPEATASAPGAEGWSPKDVVAHLASRQRPAVMARVGAILAQPGAVLPDVPEEASLAESGLRVRPMDEVLETFAELRAEAMTLLRAIEPAQLDLRGTHEVAGEVSVAEIINHLGYHDLLHIEQVARLLYTPIERERGAMRMF
jgi:hypothetical protein